MAGQFISVELREIPVGEELPVSVYIYLDFRFITFRAEGDQIDRSTYQRLELKKVRNLFIQELDRQKYLAWSQIKTTQYAPAPPSDPPQLAEARENAHRKLYDIFSSEHPEKLVSQTLDASKKMVEEVMKIPFAVSTLAQLQALSRGTVDHSVNVSALSVYLAMQMGYSHALILQHVGAGALMHDIGKTKVKVADDDTEEVLAEKMKDHPARGVEILDSHPKVANEVKMIVGQHHEHHDGTGYPKKMRGNAIYDLTRIVAIANEFDNQVGEGKGSLKERQKAAIQQLDQVMYKHFDPQKLEKALKILKLGI